MIATQEAFSKNAFHWGRQSEISDCRHREKRGPDCLGNYFSKERHKSRLNSTKRLGGTGTALLSVANWSHCLTCGRLVRASRIGPRKEDYTIEGTRIHIRTSVVNVNPCVGPSIIYWPHSIPLVGSSEVMGPLTNGIPDPRVPISI